MANYASVSNMGNPLSAGWYDQNIVPITVNGQTWNVNRAAAPAFEGFLKALIERGYNPTSSGGYNYRPIRGSDKLSQHSFGTAIDINAATNPMLQGQLQTDLPEGVGDLAAQYGLEWGGNWQNRKDPMHFEWTGQGHTPSPGLLAGGADQQTAMGSAGGDTMTPQDQKPRGLLGNQDFWDTLAIGLEGMTLNPNQAYIQALGSQVQGRAKERAATQASNKTAAWLRSQGRDDLAGAMEGGGLSAQDAVRIAMTPQEPTKGVSVGGNLVDPITGRVIYEGPQEPASPLSAAGKINADLAAGIITPEQASAAFAALNKPMVSIDAGTKGDTKFQEAFASGDAKTIETVYNAGLAAARNIGRIDQLGQILSNAPSGAEGAFKLAAGQFGIATEGLSDLQAAQALINSLVPEQRQPGSGPMSDADLELFKQSLPRIINTPGGNQRILQTMRAIAQYDAEGAAIVQRMRAGEIDRAQAFEMLQSRANPLAGMGGPVAGADLGLTDDEMKYLGGQ